MKGFSEKGILEEMKAGEDLKFVNRTDNFKFLKIEELDIKKKEDFFNNVLNLYPEYVRTLTIQL